MKHLLSFATILILAMPCSAQFGINTGMNLCKYKLTQDNKEFKRKSVLQYNVGIYYRTTGKHVCVQPSLNYTVKGAKIDNTGGGIYYVRNKLQYMQLAVPVMLKAGDRDGDFFIGAGPYVAALLAAKSKAVDYDDNITTTKFDIGNGAKDDFKPVDVGLNIIMGFRFYSVGISLQYDLGLSDVCPVANEKITNRNFSMNLHFFLGKVRG